MHLVETIRKLQGKGMLFNASTDGSVNISDDRLVCRKMINFLLIPSLEKCRVFYYLKGAA